MKPFWNLGSRINVYSAVLYWLVIIPGFILFTLASTCSRLDEAVGAQGCAFGSLGDVVVGGAFWYVLSLSFGGILIVGPIVLVALVAGGFSLRLHIALLKKKEISLWKFFLSAPMLGFVYPLIAILGAVLFDQLFSQPGAIDADAYRID